VDWAVDKAFLAAFIAIGCCRIEINRSGPTAAA
jgi:hypothetical protein